MQIKNIDFWNSLKKDSDTDEKAIEGDIVLLIDGVAFLIQKRNDINNVICIRIAKPESSLLKTFCDFRAFCEENKIQFIRVEGVGKHTYKILYMVMKYSPEGTNVIYSKSLSEELNRNVYLVKTY